MVMGLVSTLALAMAFGPQLQVRLQAVVDQADAEPIIVEEARAEAPVLQLAELQESDQPLETMDETEITPNVIVTPEPEALVDDPQMPAAEIEADQIVTAPAQNGDVPEAEWPAILTAASTALADAKTAQGKFVQTNVDGSVVTGTFALNRPGRMRFDYDDPTPVLIVSDGTTVAMEDSELETVDRVPIGATPLGLILSTQLNVEQDVDVLSVMQNAERIGIRVSDASGELDGTLTMVFNKQDYALIGWLSVDENFQNTVVDLVDVETNIRIDPRLFRLNEDEDEDDER